MSAIHKPSGEIAVETHNLTVSYNNRPVLWDIDCSLPAGRIIGIIGPNGAGDRKSTRLNSSHYS